MHKFPVNTRSVHGIKHCLTCGIKALKRNKFSVAKFCSQAVMSTPLKSLLHIKRTEPDILCQEKDKKFISIITKMFLYE